MELFENELILPGVITEIISDYSTGYDTTLFGTTDSVAVIGTAFNGPVGKAVEIYSPEHARYVFGESYDSKSRRESSLVANIQDAWDRGCRTIYAVRVSGKEICKDYNLAVDTNLKLRVSGIFPSNTNKDLSIFLNIADQNLYVEIYKPAARATIMEKKQGLVERKDSVLVNRIDLTNMGLSLSSDLLELIKVVNNFGFNNVLVLTIVDENGNDVTLSSTEAKALRIKDAFSGLYTIGRSKTLGIPNTVVKIDVTSGQAIKKLELNSDVTAAYPIFAHTKAELSAYLNRQMTVMFDFVKVPGAIDEVFAKDFIDYEEVSLSDFDLYNKLGSGYAINAQVSKVESNGRYKVKEVEDTNPNKKTEIKDGIYSMLENLGVKYRVLAGVGADAKIKNRLPRKEDFEEIVSTEATAIDGLISVETVTDECLAEKAYTVEFVADRVEMDSDMIKANLKSDIAKMVSVLKAEDLNKKVSYKEGSLFLGDVEDKKQLFIVREGKMECLHVSDSTALDNNYVIADGVLYVCENNSFVVVTSEKLNIVAGATAYMTAMLENGSFVIVKLENKEDPGEVTEEIVGEAKAGVAIVGKKKKSRAVQTLSIEVLGTVSQIFATGEKVFTALSSAYGMNTITISSPDFDVLTVEEVVEMLNEDVDFAKLFKVSVAKVDLAQEIIDELIIAAVTGKDAVIASDREVVVNVNKFIPYRTDDNFARHLAQHCMYTSLKTAPTHGVIGLKPLLDTSLGAISNKVSEISKLGLSATLVSKKSNGTDMLDRNNMPYPIGRKVSVTFGQYVVNMDDGHSYISNMASGYAGMVSQLPLDQSSTSQKISIPAPAYELTNYQLGILTQAGYVTTKKSYSKGFVITDGITMATEDSPYKRLSASRVADGIEGVIRTVCEPFIGTTNNLANQNSLRSAIKSELEKLKGKLIEDFQFRLIADKASNSLGILDIDFAIIPLYEIKQIRNHITVGK